MRRFCQLDDEVNRNPRIQRNGSIDGPYYHICVQYYQNSNMCDVWQMSIDITGADICQLYPGYNLHYRDDIIIEDSDRPIREYCNMEDMRLVIIPIPKAVLSKGKDDETIPLELIDARTQPGKSYMQQICKYVFGDK